MKWITRHPDILGVEKELVSDHKEIVFFIGAGLSRPIGFPLWHELLHSLIQFGQDINRLSKSDSGRAKVCVTNGEFLECGQILREKLGNRLDSKLREIFLQPLPMDLGSLDFLVRLPCAGYITTNYDTAIETAFARHNKTSLVPLLPDDSRDLGSTQMGRSLFLLKLHGDAARSRFVISTKDYEELYSKDVLRRFLYAVYFKYKIVFLGYGLSDRDIVDPFELISHDYQGKGRRHTALLPDSISSATRTNLEDTASIDVCLYDSSSDHKAVGQVVAKWFVAVKNEDSPNEAYDNPSDCARLLKTFPTLITDDLYQVAHKAFDWLMALPVHWGGEVDGPAKAANLAEGLIALAAAKRVLLEEADYGRLVDDLLGFLSTEGGFVAKTLGVPQVQTHALAIYALSLYEEYGMKVHRAIEHACDWLQENRATDDYGWGRFGHSTCSRTIPSVWSYAALLKLDALDIEDWQSFRDRLLEVGKIDHVVGEQGCSVAAAGWILWFQTQLRFSGLWTSTEEQLLDLALNHILAKDETFQNETESFLIEQTAVSSRGMWVSWIHSTAPAVMLGTLGWLDSRPNAWEPLGKAVSVLLHQSNESLDGSLTSSAVRQGGGPYVFHTMYGLWSLCECLQRFSGSLINKVGLLAIQNRKVLLLRKRGTHQLIVPGGSIERNETPQDALEREIREELGTELSTSRYWKTFEDSAAFETGATVRIQGYLGSLDSIPTPNSEIADLIWVDSKFQPNELSPIVRNKVLPALIAEGLVD